MQRIFINLAVSLVTFIIGIAAASPWAAIRSTFGGGDKAEILRVEREYLSAHINRDTAALERLLSEDFAISGYRGNVENKRERLALVADSDRVFRSIDSKNVEVTFANPDRAYTTGEAVIRGSADGRDFVSMPYRFMRTYERRNGQWQVVAVQTYRHCGR